jgi:hypothetical protein
MYNFWTPVPKDYALIYRLLDNYLETAIENMRREARSLPRDECLDFYNRRWNEFVRCSQFNSGVFRPPVTDWVWRERLAGRSIYETANLHFRKWRIGMIDAMERDLTDILLNLLQRQREGEYVEQLPRKSFMASVSK